MAETNQSVRSIDPHGYCPVFVDEDCLTDEELKEASLESLSAIGDPLRSNRRANWRSTLTAEELKKLKEVEEAPPRRSEFHVGGVVPDEKEKVFEFARRGGHRAYARNKYANGQNVWYGDGVPWQNTGR